MPSKRKPYNKMKQLTRAADHFVKDVLVAYTDNLGGCVMLHRRHKRIIPPESREGRTAVASLGRPHTWGNNLYAIGLDGNTKYFKSVFIKAEARYFQDELSSVFEKHHASLLRDMNPNHLIGVAWLASPKGEEVGDAEAADILSKIGAWEWN